MISFGSVTNEMRARRAERALGAYKDGDNSALGEAIGDLIGDLLHAAIANNLDPHAVLQDGVRHYICETLAPPDGWTRQRIDAHCTLEIDGEIWTSWPTTAAQVEAAQIEF